MADDKIIRIKLDGSSAKLQANSTNSAVKSVGTSADRASDSLNRMSRVATAVITSLATAQIIKYADSWTTVNNRLNQATTTAREFSTAQQGVIEIAQRASTDIEGVATAYSRLAQATTDLDLSQDRLLDVTTKLTLALKAGGATASETSSVMIQLAQGLGSGALQGDELRSILESSIPISKALAAEFGVNVGQLKTLGSQGAITADRVIKALEGMDESSLTFTKTFSDGLTNITNALTVYVGGIDESLSATRVAGEALGTIAENINIISDAVIALAAIFGARLVGAIASSTAAMITYTKASLAATVQTNALGQVVARSTVLMNAQALAARGASTAFALIGGPAGAAFLAAAAIIYFISQAETAEDRTGRLADEVDRLKASYLDLNEKQRQIKLTNLNNEYNELQAQLTSANEKLNKFKTFAESPIKTESVRKYEGIVADLSARLDEVSVKQQAVFQSGLDGVEFTEPAAASSSTNNRVGGADTPDDSAFQATINREKLVTQQLQEEISARRAFLNGEINQRQLDEELALQEVYYGYEARRAAILENETITAEQRTELLSTLAEQEILAEQAKLDAINNATDASLQDRQAMQEAYNQSVQALQMQTFSNATALLSSLNSESKAAALIGIGIQTATAYAANSAATAAAATLAFSSQLIPGDPTSIARATAAAAKATTLGSINGGLILASGAAKGLGALSGGGSGGATGSASSGAVSSSSATTASDTQNTTRTIDLRGFDNGGYLTKEQLTELLSGDEDVIVASNSGQQQGARVGLING